MGGTFNPVHLAHLVLAQEALEALDLDEVVLLPCSRPPHKKPDRLAAPAHRLAMLRAAVRGRPGLSVSDLEVRRGGVSYSIDTMRELIRRRPRARWVFLIGADMLQDLHSWKDVSALLGLCEFATFLRPGVDLAAVARRLRRHGLDDRKLLRGVLKSRLIEISSSEIRERVRQRRAIRHLVPAAVDRYIRRHNLYRL